ncbi:hypothetical protein HKCCE2091_05890 [Rhodobacterales bacterium HKCCE2091]|nr:hypothetical protein [Rhodobacterales bacterium HKCCE2091]
MRISAPVLAAVIAGLTTSASDAASTGFAFEATLADGGGFSGSFRQLSDAPDRCPDPLIQCNAMVDLRFEGSYGFDGGTTVSQLPSEPNPVESFVMIYGTTTPAEIRFVFDLIDDGGNEFILGATYAYAGTAFDQPWDGDLGQVGPLLSTRFDNDRGYTTAVTSFSMAPVPLPAAGWLLAAGVVTAGAFGATRRRRSRAS